MALAAAAAPDPIKRSFYGGMKRNCDGKQMALSYPTINRYPMTAYGY